MKSLTNLEQSLFWGNCSTSAIAIGQDTSATWEVSPMWMDMDSEALYSLKKHVE